MSTVVRADLDGRAIPLKSVGQYHCHDFAYPLIHCFTDARALERAVQPILAATSIDYVVVFEFPGYSGANLYISNDVSALVTIGWNDRVSSFKGRNSQSGRFWTDWFYGGTYWPFCCNSAVPSLGAWDNTFSSVQRT